MQWAHFDTIDEVLRTIDMKEVEKVKTRMIKELIQKKRISTMYGYYTIVVDATGVTTYDEDPDGNLLYRSSNGDNKVYLNYILEAKLVTAEELSLSICSEPLSNAGMGNYKKQDCEQKAFVRLAAKLKKAFPHLPICLLMDGLYPNKTVFDSCKSNGWKYIITLKDGCLKNLQEAIADTLEKDRKRFTKQVVLNKGQQQQIYGRAAYQWIEGLEHKGHKMNWLECLWPGVPREAGETPSKRFGYVTNLSPKPDNPCLDAIIAKIAECGRRRWKIENEGFNCQKNRGYHLHHKYSRQSLGTLHVYYMLLQIAHLINQLVVHSLEVAALLRDKPKLTIKYLWEKMRSVLEMCRLSLDRLVENDRRSQVRLE